MKETRCRLHACQSSLGRLRSSNQTLLIALTILATAATIGHADDASVSMNVSKIELAITRGARFLVEQQHTDGTWRSKTYGLLKDGTSLTPLVLWSLPVSQATNPAREKGRAAMTDWIDRGNRPERLRILPQYPVYSAGLAIQVLDVSVTEGQKNEMVVWQELLMAHQLTEGNLWTANDVRFGGWSYSHEPTSKPAEGTSLSPLDEPNLSATVFALEGLNACPSIDRANNLRRLSALRFVERCQNWQENSAPADVKFNDGGFHFLLADEVRNKPGVAGIDSAGQTRFRSYGSTTADGLRALLLCGMKPDHPRVVAARNWLIQHFQNGAHPGSYPADRAYLQPSLDFYYAASVARAFRQVQIDDSSLSQGRWATRLADRLLTLQRKDGSWSNPAVDVREDDPLIATSFALRALQDCVNELR